MPSLDGLWYNLSNKLFITLFWRTNYMTKDQETSKIHDIISEDELNKMIELGVNDGIEIAACEGIEFEVICETKNGNSTPTNAYKSALMKGNIPSKNMAVINKYRAI